MTTSVDRAYAASLDIDSARGHLDTAACQITSAIEHLDGQQAARVTEILDHASAVLADLDRLREALR